MSAPERTVAKKALRLAEHLMQAHKRKIVDPLITTAAVLVAKRFRAQRRALDAPLDQIKGMLPESNRMARATPLAATLAIQLAFRDFSFPMFDDALDSATREAFDGGWGIAAEQIGVGYPPPDRQFNELVSDEMDATTKTALTNAMADVFKGGLAFSALVTAVDAIFKDAVENRAPMIASTEIASAFNSGAAALATAAKNNWIRVEKAWNAEPDACDICQPNADQGWIDNDESFDSGDHEPPAHPNCRCSSELQTAED